MSSDEWVKTLNLTPEQMLLAKKLHVWLCDLVERMKNNSAVGENEAKFVSDDKAKVSIELASKSSDVVKKLEQAGFEVGEFSNDGKIIGEIPIEKLEALTEIGEVKYILPVIR